MQYDPVREKREEEEAVPGGYGDPRKGEKLFKKFCANCHSLNPIEGHGIGPNLASVSGRRIAHHKDYKYSGPMKYFYIDWTDDNLNAFLRVCFISFPFARQQQQLRRALLSLQFICFFFRFLIFSKSLLQSLESTLALVSLCL